MLSGGEEILEEILDIEAVLVDLSYHGKKIDQSIIRETMIKIESRSRTIAFGVESVISCREKNFVEHPEFFS